MYANRILNNVRTNKVLYDVSLELTYDCNLNCFYCYNDLNKKGRLLSLDQYQTLLTDLADMGTFFLMLTGGEPMIHPHFFKIGATARDLGFLTKIRTNGHNLSKKMAGRVRDEVEPNIVEVSLHGATAETHDKQTRITGSFDRLIRNIAEARDLGLKLSIVTTPTLWNEHEIPQMFELSDSLNVPLRFQGPVAPRDNGDLEPLQITPSNNAWQQVKEIQMQRGAHVDRNKYEFKEERSEDLTKHTPSTCGVGVSGVDIDPFGNVQACIHLQESAGNLHDSTIKEIWDHSPLFKRARDRSVEMEKRFQTEPRTQLGAPVFCLAVEENLQKRAKVMVGVPEL